MKNITTKRLRLSTKRNRLYDYSYMKFYIIDLLIIYNDMTQLHSTYTHIFTLLSHANTGCTTSSECRNFNPHNLMPSLYENQILLHQHQCSPTIFLQAHLYYQQPPHLDNHPHIHLYPPTQDAKPHITFYRH